MVVETWNSLPCSCSPCLLPPRWWILRPGWTEHPDTRPSARSHTPSDSSRLGLGRGYQHRHWPDVLGSAHGLKHNNRKQTTVRQMKSIPTWYNSSFTYVSPAVKTCPMITSETSSGLTPARFRTSLITTEHRSRRGTVERAPFKVPGEKRENNAVILLLSSGYMTSFYNKPIVKQSYKLTFYIVKLSNANPYTHIRYYIIILMLSIIYNIISLIPSGKIYPSHPHWLLLLTVFADLISNLVG